MITLKKFCSDGTKKFTKYTHSICQVLKCLKKVKNTFD